MTFKLESLVFGLAGASGLASGSIYLDSVLLSYNIYFIQRWDGYNLKMYGISFET